MTERLNITESEYRGLPLPSYSLLKRIGESGPRALKYAKKYDSEAIDFGSLLDCKLLCPEEFNNKFYFDATEKPTAQLLELADEICRIRADGLSYADDALGVLSVADNLNLFGSVKEVSKRIAKFDNDLFWNYLKAKQDSVGKTVFTPDTLSECAEAEQILKTHPNTAWLFKPTKNLEVLTQVMIITNINGVDVKTMLDVVVINHDNETITPYDLKATEMHQPAFKNHFRKMGYYLQGSLYKEVLANYIRVDHDLCSKFLNDRYTLEDFKFIVWSRSDKYPFIWNMGSEWHKKGLNGFENIYGEHEKGVYELLDDYIFYSEHPEVEVDRSIVENQMLEL
jgi:hypothetical protein